MANARTRSCENQLVRTYDYAYEYTVCLHKNPRTQQLVNRILSLQRFFSVSSCVAARYSFFRLRYISSTSFSAFPLIHFPSHPFSLYASTTSSPCYLAFLPLQMAQQGHQHTIIKPLLSVHLRFITYGPVPGQNRVSASRQHESS